MPRQVNDAAFAVGSVRFTCADVLMNAQRLFGDKDLQLVEFLKEGLLELSNEACAASAAKVESAHDDDLIEIEPCVTLPDSLQREIPLLKSQTAKLGQQTALRRFEGLVRDGPAIVVGQREIKIVAPG
jgi:hypothetical protein